MITFVKPTILVMKDRILLLLKEKNLSATKFADIIDVQRSSISHILSGRNKPSFDFIEKILNAYPDINAQWLITGRGEMFVNQRTLFDEERNLFSEHKRSTASESNIQNLSGQSQGISNSEEETANDNDIKNEDKNDTAVSDIERIVIFYTNGKFKEYKP